MNLARLNHILIPPSKEGRDRLRGRVAGRVLAPIGWLFGALSTEGRGTLGLALVLGMLALDVYGTRVFLLWAALLGLLAAGLLVRRAFRLSRVRLEVRVPARVTVGTPVRFELCVHNDGPRDVHALRVEGPFLPWDGQWLRRQSGFSTVKAGQRALGGATARFVERGDHHLDVFQLRALLPLGLVVGPEVTSEGARFRVVPRIAPIEQLTLPLGDRYQQGGVASASRVGEALELIGVRPYRRGDPVRDLHALTWARTGIPHVREYQQEYFTRIGVCVDNDRSVTSERTLEAVVSLAAGVVGCARCAEALVDLLVVDGQVHPLTLGRSLGTVDQALDLLSCVRLGRPFDPEAVAARLAPFVAQLSCVVLITQAPLVEASARPADAGSGPAGRRGLGQAFARMRARLPWRRAAAPRSRLQFVQALEALGVRCHVLRVVPGGSAPEPTHPAEQVVTAAAIAGEEPLWL